MASSSRRVRATSSPRRRLRSVAAGLTVAALAGGAMALAGGGPAAAAEAPNAQAVGNFLDGSLGGMPLQGVAALKPAIASSPGTGSSRNPLDAKLLNRLEIPLTNALKLPGGGAFELGAVNQVAEAKSDGYSYGASGAVQNSGGASLGGNDDAFPASATINLTSSALGSVPIPALPAQLSQILGSLGLPTSTQDLAALGGIKGTISGVHALAQTKAGGDIVTPRAGIADVKLNIGSPALGAVITQIKALLENGQLPTVLGNLPGGLGTTIGGLLGGLTGNAGKVLGSSDCQLTGLTPTDFTLTDGVTLSSTGASIDIDAAVLVKSLTGLDLANLSTSNFDLITFLVEKLPSILQNGVEGLVNDLTTGLNNQFAKCVAAFKNAGLDGTPLTQLTAALLQGRNTFEQAINSIVTPFAASGATGLTTLATYLQKAIDIGLNVQYGPNTAPKNSDYPFTSALKATAAQNIAVKSGQSVVRAIEINLLDTSGLPSGGLGSLPVSGLPGTNAVHVRQLAAVHAVASGQAGIALALGNAAAGPSADNGGESATPTPEPSTGGGDVGGASRVPTGVPAGAAGHGGTPVLPLVIVLVALAAAAGGVASYRFRGRHQH